MWLLARGASISRASEKLIGHRAGTQSYSGHNETGYLALGRDPRERSNLSQSQAPCSEYAFAAVEDSLKAMKQFTGRKKYTASSLFKTGMRVANAVPELKRKLMPA